MNFSVILDFGNLGDPDVPMKTPKEVGLEISNHQVDRTKHHASKSIVCRPSSPTTQEISVSVFVSKQNNICGQYRTART